MAGKDGPAMQEDERLGQELVPIEQALADRATYFEGIPMGNAVRLDTKVDWED